VKDRAWVSVGVRLCLLLFAVSAIWFAAREWSGVPTPRGLDAPETDFSAARADDVLGRVLGPEMPHPLGTPENANVRARILAEFAALGIEARLQSGLSCTGRKRYGYVVCATVHNIVAEIVPGQGKSITLLAHYDSVGAGPGASDDGSGVAAIIETARALKARKVARHPVMAVITDGEEAGLLGASFFLRDPHLTERVGVVINAEARGTRGPSLLFQTSMGSANLIDIYRRHVSGYAASSLFAEIYKHLPNDTDLTPFLDQGFVGINFAFIGNVAYYHTSQDRRAHLDPATLQHHGDNLLGMVTGLQGAELPIQKGDESSYLSVFGKWFFALPQEWLPYLAVVCLFLVTTAVAFRTERLRKTDLVLGIGVTILVLAGSIAAGFGLHLLASLTMGESDPSFADPMPLRLALTCAVTAITVFCARLVPWRTLALTVWLFFAVMALVAAVLVPGAAPYVLFPALIAAPLVVVQARLSDRAAQSLLFMAAIPVVCIWMSVAALGEDVAGLLMHPLFTLPAAMTALALMPLLDMNALQRKGWLGLTGALAVVTIGLAGYAGMQPAFSVEKPQRLNIAFIDDHVGNKALWAVDTRAGLPPSFREHMNFSATRVELPSLAPSAAFVAPAGSLRFQLPLIASEDVGAAADQGVRVALSLPGGAYNDFTIEIPKGSGLKAIVVDGRPFDPAFDGSAVLRCAGDACAATVMTLTFAEKRTVEATISTRRYGLPSDGEAITRLRPATAVPSQAGDVTITVGTLKLF